jgi:protein TonB
LINNNVEEIVYKTIQKSEKRSGGMLLLVAIVVLLLHVTGLIWLREPADLPQESLAPVPFKLEVTLLGKDGLKPDVTPPAVNSQPQPNSKPQPKSKPEAKQPQPKSKSKPKKTATIKEKLPDLREIDQLIKSRSVKLVSRRVKTQPEQQTAQTVSSAMIMPPAGSASATDNFPVSDSRNPSPEYPEMAIFLGYQGTAIVRIKVSANGLSKGAEILRSSGHKLLDESAVKALKKWRFTPGKPGNTPMADSVIISVIYVLYGNNR